MKSPAYYSQNRIDEIRRLKANLDRRMRRVENDENSSQLAVNSYNKYVSENASKFRRLGSLSEKDQLTLLRDLSRYNDMKTSTIKGARNAFRQWKKIEPYIKDLSKEDRDKVRRIYEDIVGSTGLSNYYKYDVMETVVDMVSKTEATSKEIADNITRIYVDMYEKFGGDIYDKDASILFSTELQKIRR